MKKLKGHVYSDDWSTYAEMVVYRDPVGERGERPALLLISENGEPLEVMTVEEVKELLIDLGRKSLLAFTSTEKCLQHIVDTAAKHGITL